MDEILNRVLSLLKERHIPKGKFLSDLDLDRSALSEWVRGNHKSYMKYLPEIAEYFGVSLDWLAGTDQKNKPADEFGRLSPNEKELLLQFRKLSDDQQDLILRAAGADPKNIRKANGK